MDRPKTKYSLKEKDIIVERIITTQENISEVAKLYGVSEHNIHCWVSRFKKRKIDNGEPIPVPINLPKRVIDRHRLLLLKQLDYLELQQTGSREYMNVFTMYRGLLADWNLISGIPFESEAEPDPTTIQGRELIKKALQAFPADLLTEALEGKTLPVESEEEEEDESLEDG